MWHACLPSSGPQTYPTHMHVCARTKHMRARPGGTSTVQQTMCNQALALQPIKVCSVSSLTVT
jgi:hypothetical protein